MAAVVPAVLVFLFLRRGNGASKKTAGDIVETDLVQTFVRCYESSGLYTIVKPILEEATHIKFEYGGQEWTPGKTNPFVPAGKAIREFDWAIGSSNCDDPQELHGKRDLDDPAPMMEEGAHWYRTLRAALGALGISLKNPFLILLLIVVGLMFLLGGYILGNTYPIQVHGH